MSQVPLLAVALLVADPALAQRATPRSGVYNVEPNHTMVMFGVNHHGFTTYYGRFSGASGSLRLDAAKPEASSVEVSVPVAGSITPLPELNARIMGPQLLDAAKFPTMTFHSTRIARTGINTADVTGDLTLHGATRSIVLKATLHGFGTQPMGEKGFIVGFDGVGHLNRSDFGVGFGVPIVGDAVDLILSVQFDLAGS